jgi:hypothetical protein
MSKELSNEEVGAIAKLIGKDRSTVEPEYLAGYDAKAAAMAAERDAKTAQMAEYNRLAAQGLTDSEIQQAMGL